MKEMAADTVNDILRKARSLRRQRAAAAKLYEKYRGFAYRVPVKRLDRKIENYTIKLAKMGYNPEGEPFARELRMMRVRLTIR